MTKICKVTINGDVISANPGDLLLDAALINGIDLPHDCRSGYCDTCRVRVVSGRCLGDATDDPDIVHACQTRLIADLSIVVERTPEVTEVSGRIVDLVDIAPDVFEVCIQSARPPESLPGQYLSVAFRGYPSRYYSPTVPLEFPANPDLVRFHVRTLPKARVSSALGRKIKVGHQVRLTGPFGAAYFRPHHAARLCPDFERYRICTDLGDSRGRNQGNAETRTRCRSRSPRYGFVIYDPSVVQISSVSAGHNNSNGEKKAEHHGGGSGWRTDGLPTSAFTQRHGLCGRCPPACAARDSDSTAERRDVFCGSISSCDGR